MTRNITDNNSSLTYVTNELAMVLITIAPVNTLALDTYLRVTS